MKPKPNIILHRCNRLEEIEKALHGRAYGVEVDVAQLNGELVLSHDPVQMSLSQLRSGKAGARLGHCCASDSAPHLSKALDLIAGRALTVLDVKNTPPYPGIEHALINALRQYVYTNTVLITSFDQVLLKNVHNMAPEFRLGLITSTPLGGVWRGIKARSLRRHRILPLLNPTSLVQYLQDLGVSAWHPRYDCLAPEFALAVNKARIEINCWLVNSDQQREKVSDMADGIFTDAPEL